MSDQPPSRAARPVPSRPAPPARAAAASSRRRRTSRSPRRRRRCRARTAAGSRGCPRRPIALTIESAPAEPGTGEDRSRSCSGSCPSPRRRAAGSPRWALAFSIGGLVCLAVRRLGLPDRTRRGRLGDPGPAPPAREPGGRRVGARARHRVGALQRRLAALRREPREPLRLSASAGSGRPRRGRRGSRRASRRSA